MLGGSSWKAGRQKIFELNGRTISEETRRGDEWLALNADFAMRWMFGLIQRAGSPPSTAAKNDDEASQ
jgi:hypothetical protein